ncbi:MAG: C39 family peptidase [Planctomycetes bacterium]|nr:C39 family peptidase [Planctomycetota bacterium]MBI3847640.1 C39 family peptidase [Planctomycetota bacterium]
MITRESLVLSLCLGLALTGCAYTGTAQKFNAAEFDADDRWVVVRDVPLVRQESREDCGAAALTMMLAYWRIPTSLEEVKDGCPPSEHGIRAGDLREFARSKGLQAFLFHGEFDDLRRELARRRPLLVGMAKPFMNGTFTHYEVVVAVHPENQIVVTLDPARGWQQDTFDGFLREWDPVGRPTMVAFKIDESTAANTAAIQH